MKKVRVSLMALALTIAIGGAFATQSTHASTVKFPPTDTWQDTDASGNLILTKNGGHTYANESAAVTATGCNGSGADCAASVNHPDGTEQGQFIKKN